MAEKSIHIYMISGLTDIDSAGHQSFKNTVKHLSEFGYRITVFSFFPKNYPNLQNPDKVFNSNVQFHRLPVWLSHIVFFGKKVKDSLGMMKWRKKISPDETVEYYGHYNFLGRLSHIAFLFLFYLPVELVRVSAACLKEKPDIFYGVNWYGNIVSSLLGRFLKKPIITRFYGTSLQEQDLKKISVQLLHYHEILGLKIYSDAIIATNDGTKGDRILKLLNVDERKIYFWMNGIDTDDMILPKDFDPNKFKEELGLNDKKVILMVSRLAMWKRIDRGIHCIHRLVKEYAMTNIILLIAGGGPDRHRLEKLVADLEIKSYVRFLGGVPHDQIAKYFSISNIFLSLYELTNLGNPLLEAMCFGLPIITIADGSTSVLLRDGHNAFLIGAEKLSEELPSRVKLLLEDQPLRNRLGENALDEFKKKVLTWKVRMQLEDKLIQKVLREKNQ